MRSLSDARPGSETPPGDEPMTPRRQTHVGRRSASSRAWPPRPGWRCAPSSRTSCCSTIPRRSRRKAPPANERFRLGGMVAKGSVKQIVGHARHRVPGHGFPAHGAGEIFRASFPTCSARGRAWWRTDGMQGGTFVADEILAKHDEKYMPPQVAESLKNNPPPPDAMPEGSGHMIPELGHFALILALVLVGGAVVVRPARRVASRLALAGGGASGGGRTVRAHQHRHRRAGVRVRHLRFLGGVRREQFELGAAHVLSRGGAVGRARRLAAALGLAARGLDTGRGRRQPQSTGDVRQPRAGRAGPR